MADLAQALSEIKSLPDIALRNALSGKDGMIPGFLALSELHERKRVRASAGDQSPTERPSMAQEYMGMDSAKAGFAAGGAVPKGMIPEGLGNPSVTYREAALHPMTMYRQPGKGGIVDLIQPGNPSQPIGLEQLALQMPGAPGMPKEAQGYAEGGKVRSRRDYGDARTENAIQDWWRDLIGQPEIAPADTDPGYENQEITPDPRYEDNRSWHEKLFGYANGGIVGLARGGRVEDVDPRLWDVTHRAAQGFAYPVRFVSGFREGDPRFHGQHRAVDVELIDPNTGQKLANYQSGDTYGPYWEYAKRVKQAQQELYPDMNVRWGGQNRGESDKRTYGAADWMHFDTGNVHQRGGTWETGITADMARQYGVDPSYVGQGMGQTVQAAPVAGNTWADIQNSIASIESAGSGGYSAIGPETKGDRPYGRYQIMGNNIGPWTEQHLGTRMTADQFLANQQAQDAVFQGQFGQYINKYGLQGAAQAWLGGPGSVGKTGAQDILGTSVGEYGQRFMAGLNNPTATPAAATGAATAASVSNAANAGLQSAGDGGMNDMLTMMSKFGGGQPQPQQVASAPPPQPVVPINPEDLYQRGATMPLVRRLA